MKAIVKMVNGDEFTVTGAVVDDIYSYFSDNIGVNEKQAIGWVSVSDFALNFKHVVSVRFVKEAE